MRAKTILTVLFLTSLGVAAIIFLRALPQGGDAAASAPSGDEVLVATVPLATGTLMRAHDVAWQTITGPAQRGETVRPSIAAREASPEIDEQTRASVYGAA